MDIKFTPLYTWSALGMRAGRSHGPAYVGAEAYRRVAQQRDMLLAHAQRLIELAQNEYPGGDHDDVRSARELVQDLIQQDEAYARAPSEAT